MKLICSTQLKRVCESYLNVIGMEIKENEISCSEMKGVKLKWTGRQAERNCIKGTDRGRKREKKRELIHLLNVFSSVLNVGSVSVNHRQSKTVSVYNS